MSPTAIAPVVEVSKSPSSDPDRKRKRLSPDQNDEIEIDLDLPEPASKKAKRKERKSKSTTKETDSKLRPEAIARSGEINNDTEETLASAHRAPRRSDHGIWIGNLHFSVANDTLRRFFTECDCGIEEKDISRVNLPAPKHKDASRAPKAVQNRGFAYVDFTSKEAQEKALVLSEKLLVGRRVLIKDAKSFEGRPQVDESKVGGTGDEASKAASPKVFVGNLGFDVTKEDIVGLFSQAGEVDDCFLATFEDTGKCKGFGWVRFATVAAATAAVKGYVVEEENDQGEDGADEERRGNAKDFGKEKRKKRSINRLQGRQLRCEFAEDSQTRYKKRFGKDKNKHSSAGLTPSSKTELKGVQSERGTFRRQVRGHKPDRDQDKEERREERRKRHDARTVAPGAALANTQRASGAMVASAGTRISFD